MRLRTIIFTSDVVLIGFLMDERAVGLYTAAYRVGFLLLAMAVAVHVSYLPAMTRAAAEGRARVRAVAEQSLDLAAMLAAPLIVGGMIVANPLIRALFGAEYADGAGALRLVLLSVGCIFFSLAFHNILLVSNRLAAETRIVAAAAVVNIVLNVFLIPRYGLLGAASATVASEGLILAATYCAVGTLGISPTLRGAIGPLVAAAGMGLSLRAFGLGDRLFAALLAGPPVYALVLGLTHRCSGCRRNVPPAPGTGAACHRTAPSDREGS